MRFVFDLLFAQQLSQFFVEDCILLPICTITADDGPCKGKRSFLGTGHCYKKQ